MAAVSIAIRIVVGSFAALFLVLSIGMVYEVGALYRADPDWLERLSSPNQFGAQAWVISTLSLMILCVIVLLICTNAIRLYKPFSKTLK